VVHRTAGPRGSTDAKKFLTVGKVACESPVAGSVCVSAPRRADIFEATSAIASLVKLIAGSMVRLTAAMVPSSHLDAAESPGTIVAA